jgi:hypothetical protein
MKQRAVPVSLVSAVFLLGIALFGFGDSVSAERAIDAHDALEALAFTKNGSEELKSAVAQLRDANKRLFVADSLRFAAQSGALVMTAFALLLTLQSPSKKEPIQQPQQQRP